MKKGISLIMLTITMVIMLILLSVVTITGFGTYNNNQKLTFATEINMVQMMIDSYKTKNDGVYPVNADYQLNIAGVTANAKVQFADETFVDNKINLSKIDYDKLGITTLKYGNGKSGELDVYLVSQKTGKVYYAKGIKIGSNTYFTLTDDLKNIVSVISSNTTVDNESGISFTVSETDFTSNSVETIVKIPIDYTINNVAYMDTDLALSGNLTFNVEENYRVVRVDELKNNYVITIKYTKGLEEKTTTFSVSNVDRNAPSLTENSIKEKVVSTQDGTKVYLNLENITDDKSGLKQIKYAEKYIGESEETRASSEEIANYFKNAGTIVTNNVINLYEPTRYVTVYVEDNVGNFAAIYHKISDETYNKLVESQNEKVVTSTMIKANPEKYYGKTVTGYVADSSSMEKEWQIFHSDGAHIYLISKGQIYYNNQDGKPDNDECPNLPNGEVTGRKGYSDVTYIEGIGMSNVINYYTGASDISVNNPVYNKISYLKSHPASTTGAIKTVAFMVDQNVWKTYIGTNAEYAIGGPTLEQFVDSYNSVSHIAGKEKIYWEIDSSGYKVSFQKGVFEVQSSWPYYNYVQLNTEYDNMYLNGTNNVHGYRLASPCEIHSNMPIIVSITANLR